MTPVLTLVLVWFTVINHGMGVQGQDIADVKHLKTSLFANSSYDKHLRPVKNQSRPITVSTCFPDLYCKFGNSCKDFIFAKLSVS